MTAFFGRAQELATLAAVCAGDASAAAVIVGDPGSGKSRLLNEAVSRVRDRRVFHVRGYEAEEPVALAAAGTLLRELDAFSLEQTTVPLEPLRLFEAVHRSLREVESPLLVVDDLQWTDDLSRALVHYILRGADTENRRLVILAASRPGLTATAFAESLAHALPAESLSVLELGPLAREEAVELVVALAPDMDERGAGEIWRRSGGVPFWLETLARSAGSSTELDRLVTARLRGASTDATVTLTYLVVAARPLPRSAIGEMHNWSSERAERALEELVARGVVASPTVVVEPAHDLIREAALTALPEETRRSVHRQLATWLEGQGGDLQTLREAIEHRRSAGMPLVEPTLRLVSHAQRRLLGRSGLLQALEIADEGNAERASVSLHAALATLAAELGENRCALERWSVVAERSRDRSERVRALLEASRAAYLADRVDAAHSHLSRARTLTDDTVLQIAIDAQEAAVRRWLDHDVEGAQVLTQRALASASALVDAAGSTDALDSTSRSAVHDALIAGLDVAMMAGDDESGLAIADQLVEVANGLGEEKRLRAVLRRTVILQIAGRVAEAEEALRPAWSAAREHVFPALEIEAGYALSSALLVLGRLEEAERVGADAAALAEREAPLPHQSGFIRMTVPRNVRVTPLLAQLSRGDWRQAVERLDAHAREEADPHGRLHLHRAIGVWLARVAPGEHREEVRTRFAAARADADAARCSRCRSYVDLRAAESLARVGLVDEARTIAQEWDAGNPNAPHTVTSFWRTRAESMIAAAAGDASGACDLLEGLAIRAAEFGRGLE